MLREHVRRHGHREILRVREEPHAASWKGESHFVDEKKKKTLFSFVKRLHINPEVDK